MKNDLLIIVGKDLLYNRPLIKLKAHKIKSCGILLDYIFDKEQRIVNSPMPVYSLCSESAKKLRDFLNEFLKNADNEFLREVDDGDTDACHFFEKSI